MRPLLWLQLLLVSLGSREILGDEVPTDSTTVFPTPGASQAEGNSPHDYTYKPGMEDQTASAMLVSSAVDVTTNAPIPSVDIESADPISITSKKRSSVSDAVASSVLDDTTNTPIPSVDVESADPVPITSKKRSSFINAVESLAADGTTNAPIPSVDIESADPIPITNKKRASDSDAVAADGESADRMRLKQIIDYSDSKQNENILLIDKARKSRQSEASTTTQPQPIAPKKRQNLMESSESVETLPLNLINGIGDASANAFFTGDPKRRVSLSHDEFSQMLSQMLNQNHMYGNAQQDNLQSYLRPLQVEKFQDNEKESELYLDDGRQTGFQAEDTRNNDGPIYISVPLNKDYKQFQSKPQKQFQVHHDDADLLTPAPKRPIVDPPTEVIQQQQIQQQQLRPAISPILPAGAPPPPPPSIHIDQAPPAPLVPSNPIVSAPPPPPPPSIHIDPARPPPPTPSNPIVSAPPPPPPPSIHIEPAPPPPPTLSTPIVSAPPPPPTTSIHIVPAPPPPPVPSNPIAPAPPSVDTVLPVNPNTPVQPPFDPAIHANPSVPHVPQKLPALKIPHVSPGGHGHSSPPLNTVVLKPPSPNDAAIADPNTQIGSTPPVNMTVPHSCPTLLEFLNASRNVWQGIAQAGGLQAGLGLFFKAAGKVISTLTQCAKSILTEVGALFYQGVVEKMMGQLDEKPNVMSGSTTTNIKTMDGRRQVMNQKNQTKRNSPALNSRKGRRYKKHISKGAPGSSGNGDFIEAQIEEMDQEAEEEVTPEPGNVRGRKETENKVEEHVKESVLDNEDDTPLKVDNVEPGMY